jgi:hypothetical protein
MSNTVSSEELCRELSSLSSNVNCRFVVDCDFKAPTATSDREFAHHEDTWTVDT